MKSIIKLSFIALLILGWISCSPVDGYEPPTLNVSFDANTVVEDGIAQVYVSDVVTFKISGQMDLLQWYPGQVGYCYDHSVVSSTQGAKNTMQIGSKLAKKGQANNLSLQVSTDFSGVYTEQKIKEATWVTIPDSDINWATSTSQLLSKWIDFSKYIPQGSEYLYVAFAYKSELPSAANGNKIGSAWTISYFDFRTDYPDGRKQYYGIYDPSTNSNKFCQDLRYGGFIPVSFDCPGSAADLCVWSTASAAMAIKEGKAGHYDEDWAVSRRFNLNEMAAPDISIPLKRTTEDVPRTASTTYDTAGEYTITFVAKNYRTDGSGEIVKELKIKVLPRP